MTLPRHLLTIFALTIGLGTSLLPAAEPSSQPADLFESLDANSDGKLLADEVPEKQQQYFKRLLRVGDGDRNGELTRGEFIQALQPNDRPVALPGNGPGSQRARFDPSRAFKNFDRNNDGKLTRDELPQPLRDRLEPVFQRLQQNALSEQEFVQELRTLARAGMPNGRQLAEAIKGMDANGDGKVTAEEVPQRARAMVRGLLQRLGKAADGALTVDDLKRIAGARTPANSRTPQNVPEDVRRTATYVFRALDTDSDGALSPDEWRRSGTTRARFKQAGIDLHQPTSLDEFVRLFGKAFAKS